MKYLGMLEFKIDRLKEVEQQLERLSVEQPYKGAVARLRCYRGIDTLSAMVVLSEVWDFTRFAKAAHFMSYLGLVPQEHSRGKGSIDYAMDLMEYAEVAIAPGRAFGENGENYMRIALVENEQRLRQAIRNISRFVREKPIRKTSR